MIIIVIIIIYNVTINNSQKITQAMKEMIPFVTG